MTLKPLLIVKTGSTHPALARREGDFEDWILSGLGATRKTSRIVDARSAERLPGADTICGIVITGSHAMVTDPEPWLERAGEWLARQVAEATPTLAICFGHQLLAQAMGGEVGWQPGGRHLGSVRVEKRPEAADDPLFATLPATFPAPCCHAQSVLTLPPGAILLARSQADPHQAFRIGPNAWGVQFHPEFSPPILRDYIEQYREEIRARGDDPDRLIASIEPSPTTEILPTFLKRFARS